MKLKCDCLDRLIEQSNANRPAGHEVVRTDISIEMEGLRIPWPDLERTMRYCPICGTRVDR